MIRQKSVTSTNTLHRNGKAPLSVPGVRPWLWVVLILCVSLLLTGWGLNGDSLFRDELLSVGHSRGVTANHDLNQIWASVAETSPMHAPGYFLLLGVWGSVTGWSAPGLRLLSLCFVLLSIAWTYRLGRDFVSPQTGVYAAFALATSALLVDYGHAVRMYTLLAALAVVVVWLYLSSVHRADEPRWSHWLSLFVGVAALIYTHYFGMFVLMSLGIYHLLIVRKNRRWWVMSATVTAAGLTFIPWLGVMLTGQESRAEFVPFGALQLAATVPYVFANGNLAFVVLVLIFPVWWVWRGKRGRAVVLIAWMAMALLIVGNAVTPLLSVPRARYLLAFYPLLALLVGMSFAFLHRWRVMRVLLIVIWLLSYALFVRSGLLAEYNSMSYKRFDLMLPFPEITRQLHRHGQQGDFVLTFTVTSGSFYEDKLGMSISDYYFGALGLDYAMIMMPRLREPDARPQILSDDLPEEQIPDHLLTLIGERDRVWLVYQPLFMPQRLSLYRQVLEAEYDHCATVYEADGLWIDEYLLAGTCDNSQVFVPARFESGIN